jgi:hypothetical protein
MPELIQTLKSMQKTESEKRRFLASIQGIDVNEEEENKGPTFEDVQRRALGIDASGDDIVSLQGALASQSGFGIGAGLGYFKG